jgi:hypothetical protein
MMPVARVMALYRRHSGAQAARVVNAPPGLDVTASRTGERVYLHVVNTERIHAVAARLGVEGRAITSGVVYEIAVDPEYEVEPDTADVLAPVRKALPETGEWTFPPASVSAIEFDLL